MAYDLRHERWIPWRRRNGDVEWGPPATLLRDIHANPVVALATGRPDFDGALQECLIGLLTAAFAPADVDAWHLHWEHPPTEEELQRALDALPPAFTLDGDGPRFLQDYAAGDFADTAIASIDHLLIETPGGQTARQNTDLFVKRNRAACLGRPAAAMALLTLQTYAPAGGRGNRTSMRGGGPLTTLIDPRVDGSGASQAHVQPLWQKLWANVETAHDLAQRTSGNGTPAVESTYPWMAAPRVSAGDASATGPADAGALQAYFGCPRRIRLEFGDAGRCDLTETDDDATVTGFRMRNYGVQYQGWKHPLSPHYRTRAEEGWLAVHPQPAGLGWRDWAGISLRAPADSLRQPAAAVARFNARAHRIGVRQVQLHAFGYDMDNMKARAWLDARLPAFTVDDERQQLLLDTAEGLVHATGIAAAAMLGAVKSALFQSPDDVRGDIGSVRQELWTATERPFRELIEAIASASLTHAAATALAAERRAAFVHVLQKRALMIFDCWCPATGLGAQSMRRRVAARYQLVITSRGESRSGQKLFASLGVPLPRETNAPSSNTIARQPA